VRATRPPAVVAAGEAKALNRMRHPTGTGPGTWSFWPLSDTAALQALGDQAGRFDYAAAVGDGLDSSVVSAALCWIMRTFPEAPAVVQRLQDEQWRTIRRRTAMGDLLARPNRFYDGRILWMATCLDFAFGEAFWLKIRNVIGEVIEHWWMPRGLVTPRAPSDGSEFISHYDYKVGSGPPIPLQPRDVVHFRFGMDPRNIRRGFSQLAAVVREVYTDEQACAFTAAVLKNLGIIGVVISPKVQEGSPASAQQDVQEVRDYIDANFTGDRRGKTLAVGSPTEAQLLQYNLEGFNVGPIRDIAEERVTAALAIPAAVIGFGTGLQQTKVGATMRELIQLAWTGCLMPMQKILASELDRSVLPEFYADTAGFRAAFDTTEVRAVWEDEKEKGDRVSRLFTSGVMKRGEARAELGLSTDDADDIFVLPTTVVPEGEPAPPPVPPAPIEPPDPTGED
jgi:hypothetical protein